MNDINYQNFDYNSYITKYPDLSHFKSKNQAWNHYNKYGKKEGRTFIDKRSEYILFKINENKIKIPNEFNTNQLLELFKYLPESLYLYKYKITNTNICTDNIIINKPVLKFIYDEYLEIYPYYKNVFSSKLECYKNFLLYCKLQKLIPNLFIFNIIQFSQEFLQKQTITKFNLNYQLTYDKSKYLNSSCHFIILSRTHNRQKLFDSMYNSIINQFNESNEPINQ